MSNAQAAFLVGDRIFSRLFDHRQFSAGQIEFIVKGMEDATGSSNNLDRLLKTNENVCVISDAFFDDISNLDEQVARNVHKELTSMLDGAVKVLEIDNESRLKEEQALGKSRIEREQRKQNKIKSMTISLQKLEESLLAEEIELERKYLKLEENLKKI